MVYQQSQGLLYVLGFVASQDQPTPLYIRIPAGVATASADGAPNAEAQLNLQYEPPAGEWRAVAHGRSFTDRKHETQD